MILYYKRDGTPYEEGEEQQFYKDFVNWDLRQVALDLIGNIRISTVWLGMDHGFLLEKPIIFETMVFSHPKSGYGDWCERYCTEDEALAGHYKILQEILNECSCKEFML